MKGFILFLAFGLTACAPSYRQMDKGSATGAGRPSAPLANAPAQPRVQEQADTWAESAQDAPPVNTAPVEMALPPPEPGPGAGSAPEPQEPAQPVPPASPFPEENDPQSMDAGPVAPAPPPVSAPVEKPAPPPAVKLPRTPLPIPPTPPPSEPKPKSPVVREPAPVPSPEPAKPPAPASNYRPYPALWEKRHRDGVMWSAYLSQLISSSSKLSAQLLTGSKDIKSFCPRYHTLSADQRVNFWVVLASAIAKPESDLDPTNRSREGGMGIDRVTGQHVYSEGLLQLSYQDSIGRSYCEFDWGHDRRLSARSPKKTILDPLKNLKCGIHILANQIQNQGRIATSSGVYWSVLVPGGRYSKLGQIRAVTRKIPFCG